MPVLACEATMSALGWEEERSIRADAELILRNAVPPNSYPTLYADGWVITGSLAVTGDGLIIDLDYTLLIIQYGLQSKFLQATGLVVDIATETRELFASMYVISVETRDLDGSGHVLVVTTPGGGGTPQPVYTTKTIETTSDGNVVDQHQLNLTAEGIIGESVRFVTSFGVSLATVASPVNTERRRRNVQATGIVIGPFVFLRASAVIFATYLKQTLATGLVTEVIEETVVADAVVWGPLQHQQLHADGIVGGKDLNLPAQERTYGVASSKREF